MDRKEIIIIICLITLFIVPCFGQSEYRVQPGDTVYGVSRKFDIEPSVLMELNGIKDASRLKAGQVLKIPDSYEVKPGDSYYGIARKLGLSVSDLLAFNGRTESSPLLIGDSLQIPRKNTAAGESGPAGIASLNLESTAGSQIQKIPQNTIESGLDEDYFWPHDGNRTSLTGKLKGAEFDGQQGDSVFSVSSGKVIWVAPYRGYNKLIIVESPDTHIYAYGGNDLSLVTVGDLVFPGMEIGRLGINPHEGTAKAFFFVYKNGTPVDPAKAPRT